jgi:galactokinase
MPEAFSIPAVLKPYIINKASLLVRSPGRINLIGEHTDYNNGFVLPAAIDKAVYIAVNLRNDNEIHLHALDLKEDYSTNLSVISHVEQSWPNYILGVVVQFMKAGIPLTGFDLALTADIPIGAGLSSSAAVESAVAMALNELFHAGFPLIDLVKMGQKAENEFVGVQCGIMDQFASMFGKRDNVIRLDCQSLEYKYVPFSMEGIRIVLLDTHVKHSLASSEYNVRRSQCEAGVALVKARYPEVKSLRDVSLDMLSTCVLPADKLLYQRCKYVVDENIRLQEACEDLNSGDLKAFGLKMYGSHEGLSKMYAVSCPELDFLVDAVKDNPAVLGARMMGGGFGGCTINLVKEAAVDNMIAKTAAAYKKHLNRELTAYVAKIEMGTCVVKNPLLQ